MKSHAQIAELLREMLERHQLTQAELCKLAGISQRTLTKVLIGQEDFKVSTLFALVDRLGLELVIVPKMAVRAVAAGFEVREPVVKTRVQAALDRMKAQISMMESSKK